MFPEFSLGFLYEGDFFKVILAELPVNKTVQ